MASTEHYVDSARLPDVSTEDHQPGRLCEAEALLMCWSAWELAFSRLATTRELATPISCLSLATCGHIVGLQGCCLNCGVSVSALAAGLIWCVAWYKVWRHEQFVVDLAVRPSAALAYFGLS